MTFRVDVKAAERLGIGRNQGSDSVEIPNEAFQAHRARKKERCAFEIAHEITSSETYGNNAVECANLGGSSNDENKKEVNPIEAARRIEIIS